MILYHTVSTYHILRSILHKLNYHAEEEAVILVPAFFPKMPYGLKCKDNFIFSKIIFYDWEFRRYERYPEDVFERIEEVLEFEIGPNYIEQIDEFNIFNGARFFGSYLASKDIRFNWFEEADGRYSNPLPPMQDDQRMYPERYELAAKLGLYDAQNEYIDKIYISKKAQRKNVFEERIFNFEVIEELEKLSKEQQEKLKKFWGINEEIKYIPENTALIMSQHFCNIKLITFEEQVLLYQMTVDYFLEGYSLHMKLHPSDMFPYKEFIEDIEILDADYPSELLKYSCQGQYEVVAAVSSTGAKNLSNISKKQLVINEDYIKEYKDNDLYYFVCQLIEKFPHYSIEGYGINNEQMKAMLMYGTNNGNREYHCDDFDELDLTNKVIILGDKIKPKLLEKILLADKENTIIIFMKLTGYKYEREIFKEMHLSMKTINLCSSNAKRDCWMKKNIYVCSDKKEIIDIVDKREYVKYLLNTGIKMRVDENSDKDIQIKALSGMLDATEKRLENCILENNYLKQMMKEAGIKYE